ncbi:chemotaxis response regulator protein-glutamate methylesterase [Oceanisphaera profunda]|uniref:Protein-glutamate methylesterase/protein-glutamine glutaminase n=1 Tax=Oceanisphaera profunda TaxID=1416627 RepID=A0A1Y0D8N5_9GAMM|nr:chemotaxis response regulator protein-glutamate methylesterase [Oceanisphaera profunda]ART83395.1 chemotaxis response regulator protein-glutamate methylesterase [Oceanisphaera profunda]
MAIRVLVVDDSSFFRRRVSEILEQDPMLTVVDTAVNGLEAVEKARAGRFDVITMDIEMPVMDGISAVREIMKATPTPVLMFSSLTHDGAQATLDALDAGAMDFLPKRFEDIARSKEEAMLLLQQRVKAIARRRSFIAPRVEARATTSTAPAARSTLASAGLAARPRMGSALATSGRTVSNTLTRSTLASTAAPAAVSGAAPVERKTVPRRTGKSYQLLAIGTSTGGPVALQKVLTALPANFPHPILLIQHMPGTFTTAFAARLNTLCQITVKEAEDGDALRPGCAYLAPGGKQMLLEGRPGAARLRIIDGNDKVNYKPCVDITFASAAKIYGGKVLAVVLTGMGADGREGARLLKDQGASIWAQDEETCVVYGMPQAVAKAGLASESLPLPLIGEAILNEMSS